MAIHESNVNFKKLISDLAEMYPYETEEVVMVELVANSLDAHANKISIDYDPGNNVLIITDNGAGMTQSQFADYHDFAAGWKSRGFTIGFAGVGAKLSFNVADRVLTETKSKAFSNGSDWYLASKNQLKWKDRKALSIKRSGTRVEVHFRSTVQPEYADEEALLQLLKRHYLPLFDKRFLDLYDRMGIYSKELRFIINGSIVEPSDLIKDMNLDQVKEFAPQKGNKKIGYGILGVAQHDYPFGVGRSGLFICTHGKVIKAEFFNQFPGILGPRILGVVEVPELIGFLTTGKTDFLHNRGNYKQFEFLYSPIRHEFKSWLGEIGVQQAEISDLDDAQKLERELRKIASEIPELRDFFGFWMKDKSLQISTDGDVRAAMDSGIEATLADGDGTILNNGGVMDVGNNPGEAPVPNQDSEEIKATPISRSSKRGPKIGFIAAPDRLEMAWIDGDHIMINTAHPSHCKIKANSLAKHLHNYCAIGTAIQRFIISSGDISNVNVLDRLMAAWGNK